MLGRLLDATTFLTRVPLPVRREIDLARAAWAFPVVGAATGLLLGAVGVLTVGPLGWLVAAVLVVLLEVVLTGALHLDGLADCADGTGGTDRETRLRIMKDHASGVYGVAAVVLDLLLKVALVGALLQDADAPVILSTTAVAWTLSRVAMLPLAAGLPYAREHGTGRTLVTGLTRSRVTVALGTAGVLVVLTVLIGTALGGAELAAAVVPVLTTVSAVVVVTLLVARWAHRTLGGVTGDVLGAAAEVTLLAALMAGYAAR
jgi:adenosylcobinamide-GDP ribazoletransferase